MSRRATPLLIEDIWEAIEKIERYVSGLDHAAFIKDDKTVDSVVRNLEIIGEAAKRIPENIRAQYSGIEWRRIIGLRNRIVHDYFSIDVEIVWEIVKEGFAYLQIKACINPRVTHKAEHFHVSGIPKTWKLGRSAKRLASSPCFA
jgi:uncharacterized protein with HEPN domain